MESKKSTHNISNVLLLFAGILAGFAAGLNVGSQLFTERPDFITWILIGSLVLISIIIPFVKKKEKERGNEK